MVGLKGTAPSTPTSITVVFCPRFSIQRSRDSIGSSWVSIVPIQSILTSYSPFTQLEMMLTLFYLHCQVSYQETLVKNLL
jgi:hypothetical protein